MNKQVKVEFLDGRTFEIGQRVVVIGEGHNFEDVPGVVVGFGEVMRAITIKVKADNPEMIRENNRWQLAQEGEFFDRLRDHGVFGGELK